MSISLVSRTPSVPSRTAARLAPPLRRIVRSSLALEERKPGEIAIVLADDALLRELNRAYRGIDRSTDVLSFPYEDHERGAVAGDLVISMHRAVEQAARYRVSVGRELARLVVHGTLHLAGLDHHSPAQRLQMRARERSALDEARENIAAMEEALGGPFRRRPRAR